MEFLIFLESWLREWQGDLNGDYDFTPENLSTSMQRLKKSFNPSSYMVGLRWALTGTKVGATVLNTMHVLGRSVVSQRISNAIHHLHNLNKN